MADVYRLYAIKRHAAPMTVLHDQIDLHEALSHHPPIYPVILDFDETLWLRNSTEEFFESVRPRWLAAIVLQIIGAFKPWRLLQRGEPNHWRDWTRLIAVLAVAPWSLWLWRRRAAELGPLHLNHVLLETTRRRHAANTLVVSFGFREIVQPLLLAIDPHLRLAESSSLRHGRKLRAEGKAEAMARLIGATALRRSVVVTDSDVDRDLLEASDNAFLIKWPDARYAQAGLSPLMPFAYLQRVKRPDENYLRNAVLGHDLPVLLLAFAFGSESPLLAGVAILIFTAAFFTAYEIGYHENDRLGLLLESQPKVSANYHTIGSKFSPGFAWCVALIISAAGSLVALPVSWIADLVDTTPTAFLGVWAAFVGFLLTVRLVFHWQNVIPPQGRIVPMLGLQVARVLGYAVIFPTSVVGALFCVAHGVSRWLPYVVYRFGGSRRDVPNHLIALLMFVTVGTAIQIGGGGDLLLDWQAALILAYLCARGAKDLLRFAPKLLSSRVATNTLR